MTDKKQTHILINEFDEWLNIEYYNNKQDILKIEIIGHTTHARIRVKRV